MLVFIVGTAPVVFVVAAAEAIIEYKLDLGSCLLVCCAGPAGDCTDYLSEILRRSADLRDPSTLNLIRHLAGSKLAIMDASGYIVPIGEFINERGILFSNGSYTALRSPWAAPTKCS